MPLEISFPCLKTIWLSLRSKLLIVVKKMLPDQLYKWVSSKMLVEYIKFKMLRKKEKKDFFFFLFSPPSGGNSNMSDRQSLWFKGFGYSGN